MAAAIVAGLPPFNPFLANSEDGGSNVDGMVRLPKFLVYAPKLVLTEPEVMSKSGMERLLRKRYPGASFKGQDPYRSVFPNYAALMYREDIRLTQIDEFRRLTDTLKAVGDLSGSKELRKEMQSVFVRHETWQEDAMDRSYNNDRR
jgi:hypothetical protein